MELPVELLNGGYQPQYAHTGDAGLDLRANAEMILKPFERKLCPTGIKIEIPAGYAGLVVPRSGNAIHRGLTVLNTPGVIDSGYRGEVQVILYNASSDTKITVKPGERIAQLLIQPVVFADIKIVEKLSSSERNADGFGSTGK
ncbi:MAG: dUTP diphosphatase [Bifidobacteriaceae bacterium]|jgi:dUTP pyrophosphatase|nr:dUTP diphosphatase [Bifidobacteriaceae bacterium]